MQTQKCKNPTSTKQQYMKDLYIMTIIYYCSFLHPTQRTHTPHTHLPITLLSLDWRIGPV